MAATFVDLGTGRALRIVALESSKQRARELFPGIADKNQQQMKAYREMDDSELFGEQWVDVAVGANEMPGYKGARVACAACGEGINYERFVERDGETLCLACAHPEQRYYRPAQQPRLQEEHAAHRRSECA
jgi:formylmethanofuran dehydrogenase subunit E